ncbi:Acyl-ACP thioesterase [Ruminococcaceae bacterium YRB3002]|nr:Acyl-ACP thioesterase [Ruminococcaceae bacterium YRB3002]
MQARQKFFIGLQDVGEGNRITNKALIEALSNATNVHGKMVGQSTGEKDISHLTWIVLNWKLVVYRRPGACSTIEVVTWGQAYKGLQAGRDYEIYDEDGSIIARATSNWVAMNPDTGRPIKLTPEQIDGYKMEKDRVNFPDFRFTRTAPELPLVNRVRMKALKSMIDMNGHVHNAAYMDLAEEAMPDGVDKILFDDVEVCYRKEIKPDEYFAAEYYSDDVTHCVIIKNEADDSVHAMILLR